MTKSSIGKCAFFWIVGMTSVLSANEDKIFQAVAEQNVFRHARSSIDRVEEGKIFFKSDKICVYQGTVYVEDMTGSALPIPALFSSEGRPFMQVSESIIFNTWTCGNCNAVNHKWDNPRRCWRCNEPR